MTENETKTEFLARDLFENIGNDQTDTLYEPRPKTVTQSREFLMQELEKTRNKNEAIESVDHFKQTLFDNNKQIQFDAAKAIGYTALIDGFTTLQKIEISKIILEVLTTQAPRPSVSFALMEALQRVDVDAFWQFVVTNYAEKYLKKS